MADLTTTVKDGEILELAYNVMNTSPHVGRQQQVELLAPDGTVIDSDAILLEAEDSERGVLRTGALSETDSSDEGVYEVISEEGSRTVQVYVGILNSTITRPDDTDSNSLSRYDGEILLTKTTGIRKIEGELSKNTSNVPQVGLYDSDGNTIETDTSVSSAGDIFTFDNLSLADNTEYQILIGDGSATYTFGFTTDEHPYESSNGDLVRAVAGSTPSQTSEVGQVRAIQNITLSG